MAYIEIKDCYKEYKIGDNKIVANDYLSFEIEKQELAIILGPSGAGKSTILNILGGMDKLDSGSVVIDDKDIAKFSSQELVKYRRNDVGFVFQFYNLIPNLTSLENVEMASEITSDVFDAKKILNDVGLANRLDNFPAQLSGGEQQRVAIARAVVKNPKLLLCDEPTGALDYKTGKQILKLLQDMTNNKGMTIVIVTHNTALASIANRVIEIRDGKVKKMIINENPKDIMEIEW